MSRIYLGNVVRLTAAFTNTDNEAVDPTEVTLFIQTPDGEDEDEITPTKAAVGSYYHDYTSHRRHLSVQVCGDR